MLRQYELDVNFRHRKIDNVPGVIANPAKVSLNDNRDKMALFSNSNYPS